MKWIVVASLEEGPPVVYGAEERPDTCEEIAEFVSNSFNGDEPFGDVVITGFTAVPASGKPFAVYSKFFGGHTYPVILPDEEEEKPRSIGFAAQAA